MYIKNLEKTYMFEQNIDGINFSFVTINDNCSHIITFYKDPDMDITSFIFQLKDKSDLICFNLLNFEDKLHIIENAYTYLTIFCREELNKKNSEYLMSWLNTFDYKFVNTIGKLSIGHYSIAHIYNKIEQ